MERLTRFAVLCVFYLAAVVSAAPAQIQKSALDTSQPPQFLLALGPTGDPTPVEPSRSPALQRRITVDLPDATLGEALQAIADRSGINLMYSSVVAPLDRRVGLQAENTTVAAALTHVLRGTGVDVLFIAEDRATLVRQARQPAQPTARQQTGVITGRVVEGETNAPIASAQILIDSVGRGITNTQGVYRITGVKPGRRTVSVISVGYRGSSQEVEVADGTVVTLNFELEAAPTQLAELVVTATGEQRRVELGNDITVLRVESILANEPVTTVTDLLEGRVPGLVVQRTSGAPGDPARIRLRGVSSPLMSNDPIIVVDGIRVYSEQSDERGANLAADGISNFAAPSPLDYIDPHSIETIQVIKGPSATTLYGQDAANGVIVITTKRGQAGATRWQASAEYGTTRMAGSYPELLVRWGREFGNDTRVFCPINNLGNSGILYSGCQADTVSAYQILNDPKLTVLDRGHGQAFSVGVSGGSSALTYAVTGSYGDELGLIRLPAYEVERYRGLYGAAPPEWMRRPQRLERWSATSRIAARLGENAEVSLTSMLSRTMQQRSKLEQQLGSLMSTYLDRQTGKYFQPSNMELLEDEDGNILQSYYERATADAKQFTNAASLNWRPFSWLSTSLDAGLDVVQRADEIFVPRGSESHLWSSGLLRLGKGTSVVTTVNARAAARLPLQRGFQLELAGGIDYSGRSIGDLIVEAQGLVAGTESLHGAERISSADQRSIEQATFGWYIQPTLSNQRIWLSTGIRLDGGTTFGSNIELPIFPKLSLSYLISEEQFFPASLRSVFNTLRLRAAYGQAGRQPGPVDRLRLFGAMEAVRMGGTIVDGVVLGSLGNTELKPERSEEIEAGVDTDLFDDHLSLSLTYYRQNTTDMLLDVPVAPSVYGDNVKTRTNIGQVRNTGVEAGLSAQLVRSAPLTWGMQLSFSRNRNEVIDLGPGVEPFYTAMTSASTGIRVAPGYPLFGRWTRPILGYADINRDGVLVSDEVFLGDSLVYVGSTLPDYTAALHTSLSLLRGAVLVTAGFLYENGLTQRNQVAQRLAPFSRGWNDSTATLDQQLATILTNSEYNWIQTINSLRFNSLSVTYYLPARIARNLGSRALSISLQGSNLGLWTNYRGLDPHVNAKATGNDVTDSGVLPRPRIWQVRVNASF